MFSYKLAPNLTWMARSWYQYKYINRKCYRNAQLAEYWTMYTGHLHIQCLKSNIRDVKLGTNDIYTTIVYSPQARTTESHWMFDGKHLGPDSIKRCRLTCKTVVRSSYLHDGISYTGKTTSFYWIGPLIFECTMSNTLRTLLSKNAFIDGKYLLNHLPATIFLSLFFSTFSVDKTGFIVICIRAGAFNFCSNWNHPINLSMFNPMRPR